MLCINRKVRRILGHYQLAFAAILSWMVFLLILAPVSTASWIGGLPQRPAGELAAASFFLPLTFQQGAQAQSQGSSGFQIEHF